MVALATDAVDAIYRQAQTSGVEIEARVASALTLLERLTEPHSVAMLSRLLALLEQMPGGLAMVVDIVDAAARQAAAGVDLEAMLATMEGKDLMASYDGYTSCPLVTGYGSLSLAEFDYDK